ncbi:MAG: winged helix-turn-helix transcriptional regulator [Aristaeellaceae bacterium]
MTYAEYRALIARTDLNADCPVKRLLTLFSGKWHIRVIFELTKVDSIRFGELKRRIGDITNTMLSGTLRDLEEYGIVRRTQYNEIPPHVDYALTEAGQALYPVFYEMALWGSRYPVSARLDSRSAK